MGAQLRLTTLYLWVCARPAQQRTKKNFKLITPLPKLRAEQCCQAGIGARKCCGFCCSHGGNYIHSFWIAINFPSGGSARYTQRSWVFLCLVSRKLQTKIYAQCVTNHSLVNSGGGGGAHSLILRCKTRGIRLFFLYNAEQLWALHVKDLFVDL